MAGLLKPSALSTPPRITRAVDGYAPGDPPGKRRRALRELLAALHAV